MPSRHRIITSVVIAVALLVTAAAAQAQRQLGPDPSRRTPKQDYVPVSAVADEKLALAQRMERLKEWDKAADVYEEIIEKYKDRVIPIASADGGAAGGDNAQQ